eukprot:gene7312-biopygen16542
MKTRLHQPPPTAHQVGSYVESANFASRADILVSRGVVSRAAETTRELQGETAEDASGTRPFLQTLSCGTRPGRVRSRFSQTLLGWASSARTVRCAHRGPGHQMQGSAPYTPPGAGLDRGGTRPGERLRIGRGCAPRPLTPIPLTTSLNPSVVPRRTGPLGSIAWSLNQPSPAQSRRARHVTRQSAPGWGKLAAQKNATAAQLAAHKCSRCTVDCIKSAAAAQLAVQKMQPLHSWRHQMQPLHSWLHRQCSRCTAGCTKQMQPLHSWLAAAQLAAQKHAAAAQRVAHKMQPLHN